MKRQKKEVSDIQQKEAIEFLRQKVQLKGIQMRGRENNGSYRALLRFSTLLTIFENRMDCYGWVADEVCANQLISLLDVIYILACMNVITADEQTEWDELVLISGRVTDKKMEDTTDIENE